MIKLKPLGKIAHLDMHDPWNRLRGGGVAILRKQGKKKVLKRILSIHSTYTKSVVDIFKDFNKAIEQFSRVFGTKIL